MRSFSGADDSSTSKLMFFEEPVIVTGASNNTEISETAITIEKDHPCLNSTPIDVVLHEDDNTMQEESYSGIGAKRQADPLLSSAPKKQKLDHEVENQPGNSPKVFTSLLTIKYIPINYKYSQSIIHLS